MEPKDFDTEDAPEETEPFVPVDDATDLPDDVLDGDAADIEP
jgi:hypothetical protein